MKIIKSHVELVNPTNSKALMETIERAGRVCYKSEDKIGEGSDEKFIRSVLKRGHEAVIEHGAITLAFTCDRGVTHEIVRHRIASYCQESTRYCNYGKDKFGSEVTFIAPAGWDIGTNREAWNIFLEHLKESEMAYLRMLDAGCTPQQARAVLPNATKTEIFVTMNPREWRHFCTLRCPSTAHPDMRRVAHQALFVLNELAPVLFGDLYEELYDVEVATS